MIKLLLTTVISIATGYAIANAFDKEFINNWAQANGYSSNQVRTVNSLNECHSNEWFENTYGLCIKN